MKAAITEPNTKTAPPQYDIICETDELATITITDQPDGVRQVIISIDDAQLVRITVPANGELALIEPDQIATTKPKPIIQLN